jgi:hypothetical protein
VTFLSWLLSLWAALSQAEQGVIVRGPLQLEAVPAVSRLAPQRMQGRRPCGSGHPFVSPGG